MFNLFLSVINNIVDALMSVVFFNVFRLFGLGDNINLPFSIAVLLIGYIYLVYRLRFIQFTRFSKILKYTFGKNKSSDNHSSPIKTLLTSVASCTGMNATAGIVFMVAIGGVGTIFWIPILALLCMPFRFAEVYLSHSYRSPKSDSSSFMGGPFDYIKKGLASIGMERLGKILTILYTGAMIASGTIGVSMYEMNQSVVVFEKGFSFLNGKRLMLSIILTSIALFVILGGTKRVENFMSVALSFLSILYVATSIVVIIYNYKNLPSAIGFIIEDAISPKSIAGGFIGSFCLCARKNALSHETGLGTSGIVHALSPEKDSIKEATRSMMTPLINSLIVCMATSLVLTTTKTYLNKDIMKDGVLALMYAFGSAYKPFSCIVIAIIPMFTVNVLIGWSNYIMKCSQYLFKKKVIVFINMALFFACAFLGGIIDNFFLIMNIVDVILMFVLLINVPVVMLLSNKVYKAVKQYKFE